MAFAGFAPDDVRRGLAAVLAEREQRRVELRRDPVTRRARRRTFVLGCVLLVLAPALGLWALSFRTLVRPGYYRVSLVGAVLVLSAAIMLGASTVLLSRSPLRMPIGERLFRLLWLGPIGRAFVRFAGRGIKPPAATSVSTRPGAPRASTPAASTRPPVAAPDRVSALELRVAALERWRDKADA